MYSLISEQSGEINIPVRTEEGGNPKSSQLFECFKSFLEKSKGNSENSIPGSASKPSCLCRALCCVHQVLFLALITVITRGRHVVVPGMLCGRCGAPAQSSAAHWGHCASASALGTPLFPPEGHHFSLIM